MLQGPAITANALTKAYGDSVAVDGVTFSAAYGEVTGLLGPNGAGKTTLIRVLTTILAPSSGSFTVAGHTAGEASAIRSKVGVLPESGGYPKRKRAIDHLVYHARLYGFDAADANERALRLLSDVGLLGSAGDRIGTYSRGMRQRLGIARAMLNDAEVLFLDEPSLGLDPAGQRDILDLVARLAGERQAAVVLTSHLLDDIERLCDQIVILDEGRVVLDGVASEVLATRGLSETFMEVTRS